MTGPVSGFYRKRVDGEALCSKCHHPVRLHGERGCFCSSPPEDYYGWTMGKTRGVRCNCRRLAAFFQVA